MKIVLTGATGFVGSEVLTQLLDHPGVEVVTCLVRRPTGRRHDKLDERIHHDFSHYDSELVESLSAHRACIWALGGKASDDQPSVEYERVTHGFTLAFARAMAIRSAGFSFVYVSGMGADPSESSKAPWQRETRHLKGRTERDLLALNARIPSFVPTSFRPGGVLPKDAGRVTQALFGRWVIRVDPLAASLVAVALRDGPHSATVENGDIPHQIFDLVPFTDQSVRVQIGSERRH